MTDTLTKALLFKEDLSLFDGIATSSTRKTSTGGSQTLNKVDWIGLDVAIGYGAKNSTAINQALNYIGANNVKFFLSVGTWTLTANLTIPSNVKLEMAEGAQFSGAYTLTINGDFVGSKNCFGSDLTVAGLKYANLDWWAPDGTADDTEIQKANDAISSSGGIVYFPLATYTIDSSLDFSAETKILYHLADGATFARNTGDETITFYEADNLLVSPSQILTTADMLRFSKPGTIYARWFGVLADGSTDDATAITYAVNASVISYIGGKIIFPPGTIVINSTVTLSEIKGLEIYGAGMFATTLSWTGNDSTAMFLLVDCFHCHCANFNILANSSTPLSKAFQLENGASSNITPSGNSFYKIFIDGDTGYLDWGFYFNQGAGGNANNDLTIVEDCFVQNYAEAAAYIGHQNSHHHRFINCNINSNDNGKYGVHQNGGFFYWIGGSGGFNTEADFYLQQVSHVATIIGFNSEGSSRFMDVRYPGGITGATQQVTIIGCRWENTGLNADQYCLRMYAPGFYLLLGNRFGSQTSTRPKLYWDANSNGAKLISKGNYWAGSSSESPYYFNDMGVVYDADLHDMHISPTGPPESPIFADGDATPSAYSDRYFKTANTGATTITAFDDTWEGHQFSVLVDSNTTIDFTGTNLIGNGGVDWTPASTGLLKVVCRNGKQYCTVIE